MKSCGKCKASKPRSEFNMATAAQDGLCCWCRSCQAVYRRTYWAKNKKRELAQIAAYYRKHADHLRARRRQRRDPVREAAYARACYWKDPEKYKRLAIEYRKAKKPWRAWRKRNPLRSMALVRDYQMRKRGVRIEKVSYDAIFARDKGLCHICGMAVTVQDVHFDHVIPLSRGGLHQASNIKASHARCNMAKGARLLSELGAQVILKERGLA